MTLRKVAIILTGLWVLGAMPSAFSYDLPKGLVNSAGISQSLDQYATIMNSNSVAGATAPITMSTMSIDGSGAAPNSIQSLANALNADPTKTVDRVYQYVHDNVELSPAWGVQKGALGALIDGNGTEFDQAALMVELLIASGAYDSTTVKYIGGVVNLSTSQLADWFGLNKSQMDASGSSACQFMTATGRARTAKDNAGGTDCALPLVSMDLYHIWVQVNIGGTWFYFDPSYKKHNTKLGLANLGAVIGYTSAASFMSTTGNGALAGATVSPSTGIPNYVQGINRTGIRANLLAYSNALANYIKTPSNNLSDKTLDDVIGGRIIVPVIGSLRNASLVDDVGDDYLLSINCSLPLCGESNTISDDYRPILRVQFQAKDVSFTSDQLYGNRLSVKFNSQNKPVLYLDGISKGVGATVVNPGAGLTVGLTVLHKGYPTINSAAVQFTNGSATIGWPGNGLSVNDPIVLSGTVSTGISAGTYYVKQATSDTIQIAATVGGAALTPISTKTVTGVFYSRSQAFTQTIKSGGVYVIGNGWGPSSRSMVDHYQRDLSKAKAVTGSTDTDEAVLGASLSVLASTWLAEWSRSTYITGRLTDTTTIFHHCIGIAGQTPSISGQPASAPYVDLPGNSVSVMSLSGDNAKATSAFYSIGTHLSMLESAATQQVSSAEAASTVRLIDKAASVVTNKIYAATQSNYASQVSGNLLTWGYSAATKAKIDSYMNVAGNRVILPNVGNITDTDWTWIGAGYFVTSATNVASMIEGGLSGGYAASSMPATTFNLNAYLNPYSLNSFSPAVLVSDPVDPYRGSFIYKHEDLKVGAGDSFPYSLAFERSYSSAVQQQQGSLGNGFTHNFSITAIRGSDGFQGLGEDSPLDAVAAIVEEYVVQDLMSQRDANSTVPLTHFVAATIAERWLSDQLVNNTVSVTKGGNSELFVKLPDGSYNPPPNNNVVLTLLSNAYHYVLPEGASLNFNDNGYIADWTHAAGAAVAKVTFGYDGSSPPKLLTVSNNTGRTLTINWVGNFIDNVTDGSRTVRYGVDATTHNLMSFVDANSKVTTFAYDATAGSMGQMTQAFYPANPTIPAFTNTYDTVGRVQQQANANGKITRFYLAGARSEVVDPVGAHTIAYYNAMGSPVLDIDPLGKQSTTVYDGLNRVTQKILPEGNSYSYTYDYPYNRVLTETRTPKSGSGLSATSKTYTYDTTGTACQKIKTLTDERHNVTSWVYYAMGSANGPKCTLNSVTSPIPEAGKAAPVSIYTWNSNALPATVTDPEGAVTRYTYTANTEKLTSVTQDDGAGKLNLITQYTAYTAWGDATSIIDPNGGVTGKTYDTLRRLTREDFPDPDGGGPLVAPTTKYTWDDNSNLHLVERLLGGAWQTTKIEYTHSDKPYQVVNPLSYTTTYTYYDDDHLNTVTDAEGRVAKNTYDLAGRVWVHTAAFGTADARSETHTYTDNGMPYQLTDSRSGTTSYAYDGFDRLKTTTYADASYEQNTARDATDNVTGYRTRSGTNIGYTYDALNRRITRSIAGQAGITYGYDGNNRLRTAQYTGSLGYADAGLGAWTLGYDKAGRLTSESRPDGLNLSFQFDKNSNRTRVTYPGNWFVQYGYDFDNRLSTLKENNDTTLATYSWDQLSRYTGVSYNSGANAVYAYNNLGSNPYTLTQNLTLTNGVTFTYGYDNTNLRTSVASSDITYLWTPAVSSNKSYGTANTVNQYSDLGYDANANLQSDGVFAYSYDAENRLYAATTTGKSISYSYDPFGRRYSKTVNGTKTLYLHDGTREIAEYDGTGATLQTRHVFASDDAVAVSISGSDYLYAHSDPQGSIIALTDASRNLRGQVTYSPYGESGNIARNTSFGYTGQRFDSETGLYYYKARYYSPALGRFLSTDPIGYNDNLNMYAYVGNDPLNATDPSGLCKEAASQFMDKSYASAQGSIDYYSRNGISGDDIQNFSASLGAAGGLFSEATSVYRGAVAGSMEVNILLKEGNSINRVWDSRAVEGVASQFSSQFGGSYSLGAALPINAATAIETRGLSGIPGLINNAQMGGVYSVGKEIPAIMRISIGGTEPELVIQSQYRPFLNLIQESVSSIPAGK